MLYTIDNNHQLLRIGRTGENEFRTFEFDVSEWVADNPTGVITGVYRRPDNVTYPVVIRVEGGTASWTVTSTELAVAGGGEIELRITDGEVVGKSRRIPCIVSEALELGEKPPAPGVEWVDAMLAEMEDKLDANWGAENAGRVMTVGEDGNVTPADGIQPDLSQNDHDAPDYVKNRTHYVDADGTVHKLDNKFIDAEWMATKEEHGGSVELETSISFTGQYGTLTPHWSPEVGFDWDIYWNGEKYTCAPVTSGGEAFLGNRSIMGSSYPDTGEPFLFTGWALSGKTPELTTVMKSTATAETVEIVITTHLYADYNKLPAEFLPDGIDGTIDVTAAVGQTIVVKAVDENGKPTEWEAAEYQPRTHWEEVAEVLPETEFVYSSEYDGYILESGLTFTIGHTYFIHWNGTTYTCTAMDCGVGAVGNVGIETGVDTGEPFIMFNMDGLHLYVMALEELESAPIVGISKIAPTPIPAKYLTNAMPYCVGIGMGSGPNGISYETSETVANLEAIYNSGKTITAKLVDRVDANADYFLKLEGVYYSESEFGLTFLFILNTKALALGFFPQEDGTYKITTL